MKLKISKEQLKSWGACKEGYEWFLRNFPEGEGEYQDVLNALASDDRQNDADWLMNKAGPDSNAVLEVDCIVDCKHVFFAGQIVVKANISITGQMRAGRGIEAGEGIKAGRGIEAGWGIEAGEGFAIFAGLRVRVAEWTIYAKVTANTKPENLISGSWVDPVQKEAA